MSAIRQVPSHFIYNKINVSERLCLVTQPVSRRPVLDDALEDEGRHGGVDHIVGDAALGQPRLLVLAGVDRFS